MMYKKYKEFSKCRKILSKSMTSKNISAILLISLLSFFIGMQVLSIDYSFNKNGENGIQDPQTSVPQYTVITKEIVAGSEGPGNESNLLTDDEVRDETIYGMAPLF